MNRVVLVLLFIFASCSESNEEYTLYSSHSVWDSKEDFIEWTKSESFRKAHKDAGKNKPLYIGHPIFEGFEIVL